jgi:hypothetical protein
MLRIANGYDKLAERAHSQFEVARFPLLQIGHGLSLPMEDVTQP